MSTRFAGALAAATLSAILASPVAAADDTEPLRLVQVVPLPDVAGRLDHLAVDLKSERLFLSAPENNTVEVVDLRGSGKRERTMSGFSRPQGLFFVPDVKRLFVANAGDGVCKGLDVKTFTTATAETLSLGADAMDYDARDRQLYVGHGGKEAGHDYGELSVIDVATGKKVQDIRMEAHPGAILVDEPRDRVYTVIPETGRVVVVGRKTHAIVQSRIVGGGARAVSLALDARNRRLFVGIRSPGRIIVLDTESGKEMASMSTVGNLDSLSFDAGAKRIYASGGEGFVNVHRQIDPDHYETASQIATGPGARASLFVPRLKRLFVAVPRTGDGTAEVRIFEVRQ